MNDNLTTVNDNEEIMAVQEPTDALMGYSLDNIEAIAARADRAVESLNKIMRAAIKITTAKDWTLIGGTPYLQETGASKVARLFGIGWQVCPGFPTQTLDKQGYPTYTYRMRFTMGTQMIEAEGMRSAADEFFVGKKTDKEGKPIKYKSVDEVDLADVKRAAYTNCLNRGIKGILPGLRNLDVSDLEAAGIKLEKTSGYTFKTGSRGGNSGKAEDSGLVCSSCGEKITQKIASFSQGKYGRVLCMKCQRAADAGAIDADDYSEETPPYDDADIPQ